jgi:gamma-glutamylcyclotransferase (GGCT)/AIG2-like uncharacterized protein YtfP
MNQTLDALVYGTLRPGDVNYDYFIRPYDHTLERVTLNGYRMYGGGGFPYILPGEATDFVVCDLVRFTNPDEFEDALRGLDFLEGYRAPGSNKNHYDRTLVTVKADEGEIEASVYVGAPNMVQSILKNCTYVPHGDWLRFDVEVNGVKHIIVPEDTKVDYILDEEDEEMGKWLEAYYAEENQ